MSFPLKHLRADEKIIIDRHPHWWFLVPRGALLVAAIVFGGWAYPDHGWSHNAETALHWTALVLLVVTLVVFLARLVVWRSVMFVVTSSRCIFRRGVFTKEGKEIPLDQINTVFTKQNLLERMIRAGDLGYESAGDGSRETFNDIYDPVGVQNTIDTEIEAYKNRRYDRIGNEARDAAGGGAPSASLSVAEQIEKLAELRDRGVLSDEEFNAQKAALLRA